MKLRSSLVSTIILLGFIPTHSTAASKIQIYKPASSTIIYKDPNPHSRVIKKLPKNSRWIIKLSGIKNYSRSTWLHVSWNENEGWMKKSYLVFDSKATEIATKNPKCLLRETRNKLCGKN